MASKTQEIIAKCIKQFDNRLLEEIGGSNAGSKIQEKKKKYFKELSLRELKSTLVVSNVSVAIKRN